MIYINKFQVLNCGFSIIEDINMLTKEFAIFNLSNKMDFKIGDSVHILDEDGKTKLIEGEIEYIEGLEDNMFKYQGRNKAKIISDSSALEAKIYTKDQGVLEVCKDVLKNYGINIKGDNPPLFQENDYILDMGENIEDFIRILINHTGSQIISDSKGDLIIYEKPIKTDLSFIMGFNILSRTFILDNRRDYDIYKVVSYILSEDDFDFNNIDSCGIHNSITKKSCKTKLIKTTMNYTNEGCLELAKLSEKDNIQKSFEYCMMIEYTDDSRIALNNLCGVQDDGILLNEFLRIIYIKKYKYLDESSLFIKLERY